MDVFKNYIWSLTGGRKWMSRYHKTKYNVDYKTFNAILTEFNDAIIKGKVIDKGIAFKMPFFGEIVFGKYKPKIWYDDNGRLRHDRLPVDWTKSWEIWEKDHPGLTRNELNKVPGKKVVYNLNAHSDGYRFKFYWFRGKCKVVNNTAYRFRLYDPHMDYLGKMAQDPENGIDFREIHITKKKKYRRYDRTPKSESSV